jgi:subtilisin family serine protease
MEDLLEPTSDLGWVFATEGYDPLRELMCVMRRISRALILVSLVGTAVPAAAQPGPPISAEPRVLNAPLQVEAPQVSALAAKAQTRGLVRIIARIARPAGVAVGPLTVADLVATQNTFRNQALTLGVAYVEPISGLPLSVIEVDAEQLRRLVAAGLVSDVVEDIPEPPALKDSIPLINADTAAVLGATGEGQTIVILDSGVDANHPFLGGRVVSEACFSSNSTALNATTVCPGGVITSTASGSAAPCDNVMCGHGTHVAGIAAGQDANRRGVAPRANIIAIQVYSLFTDLNVPGKTQCADNNLPSPCVLAFPSDEVRALQRVSNLTNTYKIAAVNLSLAGRGRVFTTPCDTDIRKPLMDLLWVANVATVVGSGNTGSSTGVSAPGCITTAVTVGNTTKCEVVNPTSNSAAKIDLLAPGTNITSSVPGGGFAEMSGTSFAAPHVTGAFAALRSVSNDPRVGDLENALKSSGVLITDPRNNLTRPRIDLAAAVCKVMTKPTPICRSLPAPRAKAKPPVSCWWGAIWHFAHVPCTGASCPADARQQRTEASSRRPA